MYLFSIFGHPFIAWSKNTLHQGALILLVVITGAGQSKIGETAKIRVGAVKEVINASRPTIG